MTRHRPPKNAPPVPVPATSVPPCAALQHLFYWWHVSRDTPVGGTAPRLGPTALVAARRAMFGQTDLWPPSTTPSRSLSIPAAAFGSSPCRGVGHPMHNLGQWVTWIVRAKDAQIRDAWQ
jgi:hypothetical protein